MHSDFSYALDECCGSFVSRFFFRGHPGKTLSAVRVFSQVERVSATNTARNHGALTSDLRQRAVLALDQDALDVDEFVDAEVRALAAVTRLLDAAEGHARVGADVGVDEAHPGLELLGRNPLAAREVIGDH